MRQRRSSIQDAFQNSGESPFVNHDTIRISLQGSVNSSVVFTNFNSLLVNRIQVLLVETELPLRNLYIVHVSEPCLLVVISKLHIWGQAVESKETLTGRVWLCGQPIRASAARTPFLDRPGEEPTCEHTPHQMRRLARIVHPSTEA